MPDNPRSPKTLAFVFAVGFLILIAGCIAMAVRGSVLVTPSAVIPTTGMAIAGTLIGAGYAVLAVSFLPSAKPRYRWVGFLLVTPLLALAGGAVCEQIAWDAANVVGFRGSDAPIVLTPFPIRSFGEGRGGPYAYTGGRGLPTGHSITQADYAILSAAGRLRRPWRYCLPLYRQQEGTAVRVFLRRSIPRSRTQRTITIVECPAYVRRA